MRINKSTASLLISTLAAFALTSAHAQVIIEDTVTAAIAAADNGTGARATSYTLTSGAELAGFDPAGASKLVLTVSTEGSGTPRTLTATYGGTPMNPTAHAVNLNRNAFILYLDLTGTIGPGDVQLTFSGPVNGVGISLLSLSGTEPGSGAFGTSTNKEAILTTTAADSLIIAATAANGDVVPTANTPLTQLFSGQVGSATGASGHKPGGSADNIVKSSFSVNNGTATAAVEFLSASIPPPFALSISQNGMGFDFSWPSQSGKLYDLVSATDLSTPVNNWSVYDDGSATYGDLEATPSINTLTSVAGNGERRFFSVIEKVSPVPVVDTIRVFLVGGQSNADGRAAPTGLPTSPVNLQLPQDDVDFYYKVEGGTPTLTTLRPGLSETNGFGPSITFGRALADALGNGTTTRVALIKYANGGTNLASQWKAGGDATTTGDGPEYVIFQQTVTSGLKALASAYPEANITLEGMIWVQGESDISGGSAMWNAYEANLTDFINDIGETYGHSMPFLVSRLSDKQTHLNATGLAVVRAAQQTVAEADPNTDWLDTDSFGMSGDNLHFNAAGYQSIGTATATKMLGMHP